MATLRGTALNQLRNGALIAYEAGVTTPYALQNVEERGVCFVVLQPFKSMQGRLLA